MADSPLKQPELQLPSLQPLPSGPNEPAPLSTGQNLARALSIFVTGISRPDLAAALAQQFQQQDEAAKAEAENKFRSDMFVAQATNAQRIQEFGLQQEAAKAPGEAKLQAQAITKGEQDIAAGQRQERAAGVYTPEQQAANQKQSDILALRNAELELKIHQATLANLDESIKNATSEDQAQELARVRDHLAFLVKQKQDAFDAAAATAKAPPSIEELASGVQTAPGPSIAELYKSALTIPADEQAQILADIKLIAPHVPEENLKGLIAQAFNIPRPSNNVTVDSWMKAIHELNAVAGPQFIPLAATQVAKAFIAGGLSEDEANAAAADVMTNEQPPESVLQKFGKAAGAPGAFVGKSVGRVFGIKPKAAH